MAASFSSGAARPLRGSGGGGSTVTYAFQNQPLQCNNKGTNGSITTSVRKWVWNPNSTQWHLDLCGCFINTIVPLMDPLLSRQMDNYSNCVLSTTDESINIPQSLHLISMSYMFKMVSLRLTSYVFLAVFVSPQCLVAAGDASPLLSLVVVTAPMTHGLGPFVSLYNRCAISCLNIWSHRSVSHPAAGHTSPSDMNTVIKGKHSLEPTAFNPAELVAGAVSCLTLNPLDVCSGTTWFSFCNTLFLQDVFKI